MVYALPREVNVEGLRFDGNAFQKLVLTDRESLTSYSRAI